MGSKPCTPAPGTLLGRHGTDFAGGRKGSELQPGRKSKCAPRLDQSRAREASLWNNLWTCWMIT